MERNIFVHDTAEVDLGATIGEGSKVWHFSHVCSNAIIGDKVSVGQNAYIANKVVIGNNCKIQNNVSIYDDVILEDDVFCGPSMVFTNVYNPRAFIERKNEYRATLVKRGATIGANATIVCGVTLGEYCFIGAGSLVREDVADYALIVGNPGKQIGWVSAYGERLKLPLNGNAKVECKYTNDVYILEGKTLKKDG